MGDSEHTVNADLNLAALDLLLDVDLPVSICFGRARLPLEEVMGLTAGSLIELDRSVGEPADVLVNDAVIARGEIVVVDGNYGVRIQQLVSRAERLRAVDAGTDASGGAAEVTSNDRAVD